jgi:hypothetical protein
LVAREGGREAILVVIVTILRVVVFRAHVNYRVACIQHLWIASSYKAAVVIGGKTAEKKDGKSFVGVEMAAAEGIDISIVLLGQLRQWATDLCVPISGASEVFWRFGSDSPRLASEAIAIVRW